MATSSQDGWLNIRILPSWLRGQDKMACLEALPVPPRNDVAA